MSDTVGTLLINDLLPPDMRRQNRVLDKKGIDTLLGEIARRYPEKYSEISHGLAELGWRAAQESGGFSFGPEHLSKSPAAVKIQQRLAAGIRAADADNTLTDAQREKKITTILSGGLQEQQDAVYDEAIKEKNPLALQVLSGARGNKSNLASLRAGDLMYTDHRDRPIPVPIFKSYSEGLDPVQYFAGAYGARKGVADVKLKVADVGSLNKIMGQAVHRLVIRGLDAPEANDPAALPRGLPVNTSDPDNEGSLLAADTGPYKRNTVLSPEILSHLSQTGQDRILVRSPTVGGPAGGGLWSRDAGVREYGTLPGRGEHPALAASQALGEVLSQSGLASKHSGGVAGQGKAVSGFKAVERMIQVPKTFVGGATHATTDGTVGKITDAPTGGKFIHVDGVEHYVPADVEIKHKVGDSVEAGDALSDGLPDPAEVVKHKGIGEGRRYFADVFRNTMKSGGLPAHRRNVEMLARGLIDHVRLTAELGDFNTNDIVPYHTIEELYKPRADARDVPVSSAKSKYLESPVLHYTVGTKVRPSVQKDLNDFKVKSVTVHDEPPPFEPEMIRGSANLRYDPDWMTRQLGSGLKAGLLDSVHRGATSDEEGTSFVPSLAKAVDFGRGNGAVIKPEPGYKVGTFTPGKGHDDPMGEAYDIPALNKRLKDRPIETVPISDINGIDRSRRAGFSPTTRLQNANTDIPIILSNDNQCIDGRHRTVKRQQAGATHMLVRRATPEDLAAVQKTSKAAGLLSDAVDDFLTRTASGVVAPTLEFGKGTIPQAPGVKPPAAASAVGLNLKPLKPMTMTGTGV